MDFAVLEQGSPPPTYRGEVGEGEQLLGTRTVPSGTQVGYVCLYMPPAGAADGVLCCFDLLRMSGRALGPWISQGDVIRDEGSGALVLSRLSVSPIADEVDVEHSSLPARSTPPAGTDDPEQAALLRMAEASTDYPPRVRAAEVTNGGLTAAVLRDVPIGWIHLALAETRRVRGNHMEMALREALQPVGEAWFGHAIADAAQVPRRRPGRPRLSDEHLRHVAELLLQEAGSPRGGPLHARIGEKLNLLPATVRDHISAARRAGWLAPTSAGRRDAAPGPRLRAAWGDEE